MKLHLLLGYVLTVLLIGGCMPKNKCTECADIAEKSVEEINNSVDSLAMTMNSKYGHVEFPNNLYKNSKFNRIVENICSSKKQLVRIILNDTSAIKKEISLLALQHLCIEAYLTLLEELYSNYRRGKLKKEYFLYSIYTRLSDVLIMNSKNERLGDFINKLLQDSTFTVAEKSFFLKLKSGEIEQSKSNSPPS
jgi:outer membrane murein-binding lipoprotein Lpp